MSVCVSVCMSVSVCVPLAVRLVDPMTCTYLVLLTNPPLPHLVSVTAVDEVEAISYDILFPISGQSAQC